MRTIQVLLVVLLLPFSIMAQNVTLDPTTFDFWLGKWAAEWQEGENAVGRGTNHIFKVLDGKVIEENFEVTEGAQAGYKGKSLSVFNANKKEWHQAWTDNQGGYIDLIGKVDGDKRIFQTKPVVNGDKTIINRMVFYNIEKDSFMWDWEGSQDGGKTWKLQWRISYTKMK